MGAFNDIFTEVKERLGGRTNIDTRITKWINDAYFDLLMTPQYTFFELDSSTTFNTVASTRTYSLTSIASDLWFILMVRDNTNEREVRKKGVKVLDSYAYTTGHPTRYSRFGTTLILDPTPDGVYTIQIRYRKRPNELSAGGSTVFGREWDEPLTLLSVVKGYNALEQPDKAARHLELFSARMMKMSEVVALEDEDHEPTFGPYLERDC